MANGKDRALSCVLVVDDDKNIREVLNFILSKKGYLVLEAEDGQEAIEHAECCDLVLLDLVLPKISGIDVIKRLRGTGNYVPILVMSASEAKLSEVRSQGFDVVDSVSKPFNMEKLMAKVDSCLVLNSNLKYLQQTAIAMTQTIDSMAQSLQSLGMVTAIKR